MCEETTNHVTISRGHLMEVVNPPFIREFRMEEYDDGDVFYIPETHYKMEWIDMYIWI